MMVIDDQAQRVRDAVVRCGLQLLGLPNASFLARDLQVDTLVAGSGCAALSQTQRLMTALTEVLPTHRSEGQ